MPCPSLADPPGVRYLPQHVGNSRATADIEPCCNLSGALPQPAAPTDSVVTTRREPVVTTRTQPQRAWAMSGLSQVTDPSDGLRRVHPGPRKRSPGRRLRLLTTAMKPAPAGTVDLRTALRCIPRAQGMGSNQRSDLQQQAPSGSTPRAAAASSKTSAQDGGGVPCPSSFPLRSGARDGQKHLPDCSGPLPPDTPIGGYIRRERGV